MTRLGSRGLCYREHLVNQTASQNIAILAKCNGVTVSNVQLVDDSDDGNSRLRKALAANVRVGRFDFLVIGVHLKAGRNSSDHRTRDRQNRAIATFIQAELSSERDVLVVGDYNMIPGRDISNFHELAPNSELDFISSRERLAPLG